MGPSGGHLGQRISGRCSGSLVDKGCCHSVAPVTAAAEASKTAFFPPCLAGQCNNKAGALGDGGQRGSHQKVGSAHQMSQVLSWPRTGDGAGGVLPRLAAVGLVALCLGPGSQPSWELFVSCVLTTA